MAPTVDLDSNEVTGQMNKRTVSYKHCASQGLAKKPFEYGSQILLLELVTWVVVSGETICRREGGSPETDKIRTRREAAILRPRGPQRELVLLKPMEGEVGPLVDFLVATRAGRRGSS